MVGWCLAAPGDRGPLPRNAGPAGIYSSDLMTLAAGTRFGTYEILGRAGVGGMGEVYRARDTRLDRDVALKILPELFASDPDRLMRFDREAKTLASLNHPHIAEIYGIEESSGLRALVMELVEGEDLAQRIARGAIPTDEALQIAIGSCGSNVPTWPSPTRVSPAWTG